MNFVEKRYMREKYSELGVAMILKSSRMHPYRRDRRKRTKQNGGVVEFIEVQLLALTRC